MTLETQPVCRRVASSVFAALAAVLTPLYAKSAERPETPLTEAAEAVRLGEHERALALADKAVATDPQDVAARLVRAGIYDALRRHREAVADYDVVVQAQPDSASGRYRRARSRFKAANVKGAVEDFDRAVALDPPLERRLWERGIAYYYAGEFAKGARQFEMYQTYDASDVENVVWRYICQARAEDVNAARKGLMPLDRDDRRVPMMKIDALYRGHATPEDVLTAAQVGEPDDTELRHRLFYAHLYLALYFEANADDEAARRHMLEAHKREISHYMWDVADVHVKERGWESNATKAEDE